MGPGLSEDSTALWLLSIFGGPPRKLRDDSGRAAVAPDGAHVAFVSGKAEAELWLMGPGGEDPRRLLQAEAGERFLQLQWSPDSRRLAYFSSRHRGSDVDLSIRTLDVSSGAVATLFRDDGLRSFCWAPNGNIIYSTEEPQQAASDNLWSISVNTASGQPKEKPQRITRWAGFTFTDLSLTADGRRLTFVRAGLRTNVHVADMASAPEPRQLTLDERHDIPTAWLPDASSVLFHSDRNGNWDLFRQSVSQRIPEEVALGPEDQFDARLAPDGASLLYWNSPSLESGVVPMRLVQLPLGGGAPRTVLEARAGASFRCAEHSGCVLAEPDTPHHQLVFTSFAPSSGRGAELQRLDYDVTLPPAWDLSLDGATLAAINLPGDATSVRLVPVAGGAARKLPIGQRVVELTGIAWAERSLVIAANSVRGSQLILLTLDGRSRVLWKATSIITAPVVARDGKHLAFALTGRISNVWLVENF